MTEEIQASESEDGKTKMEAQAVKLAPVSSFNWVPNSLRVLIWLSSLFHSNRGYTANYLWVLFDAFLGWSHFSHITHFLFSFYSLILLESILKWLLLKKCMEGRYLILCISKYVFFLCSSLNDNLRVNIILFPYIEGVAPLSFNLQRDFLRSQCYSKSQLFFFMPPT